MAALSADRRPALCCLSMICRLCMALDLITQSYTCTYSFARYADLLSLLPPEVKGHCYCRQLLDSLQDLSQYMCQVGPQKMSKKRLMQVGQCVVKIVKEWGCNNVRVSKCSVDEGQTIRSSMFCHCLLLHEHDETILSQTCIRWFLISKLPSTWVIFTLGLFHSNVVALPTVAQSITSYPGPTQLSVTCSTKTSDRKLCGPGYEASSLSKQVHTHT